MAAEKHTTVEEGSIEDTQRGQRRINLIWELTQAIIAIIVTFGIVYVDISNINSPNLVNAFFLIVGFYFSRTNHAAIGGTGSKPFSEYLGR